MKEETPNEIEEIKLEFKQKLKGKSYESISRLLREIQIEIMSESTY